MKKHRVLDELIEMVKILNALLSMEYLLYSKTQSNYWNITGPQLRDLHKLLEEQYIELSEIVDQIAERGRSLDGWAFGTTNEFCHHAKLDESSEHYPEPCEMIANLLDDHEAVIRQLRGDLETKPAERPKYIEAFFANIDWKAVEDRLHSRSVNP